MKLDNGIGIYFKGAKIIKAQLYHANFSRYFFNYFVRHTFCQDAFTAPKFSYI